MKRESLFFICIRVVAYLAVIVLFGLLYWSYVLQEERLKEIDVTLEKVQKELAKRKKYQVLEKPVPKPQTFASKNYPNILEQDSYVQNILPLLLGNDFVPHGVLPHGNCWRR